MVKTVIAVDIDEVLSPFLKGLIQWHNHHYQTSYHIDHFTSYNFNHIWGGTIEQAIMISEEYFTHRNPEVAKPLEHTEKVLNRLKKDFNLIVVTSRRNSQKEKTIHWIDEHFPDTFADIVVCNHWTLDGKPGMKKSAACELYNAKYLIDDLPHYVEDAAKQGITGLLFGQYPWNQQVSDHPQIKRVADWQAIENFFYPT